MEFFERAHKQKNQTPNQNVTNSELTIKKELKQMLHGYKLNDNNIIKKSSTIPSLPGNIVSVESYTIDLDDDDESMREDEQESEAQPLSSPHDETTNERAQSVDEETVIALSSAASSVDMNVLSASDESGPSFVETEASESILSDTESRESESFDAEGELAAKIHSQINIVKQKKIKSCKLSSKEVPDIDSFISPSDTDEIEELEAVEEFNKAFSLSSKNERSPSPAFISIETKTLPVKSIDQILGYNVNKHNQNTKTATVDTDIFTCDYSSDKTEIQVASDTVLPDSSKVVYNDNIMFDDTPPVEQPAEEDMMDYELEQSEVTEVSDNDIEDWTSKIKVYNTANACVILLKHPVEIYISGKVKVESLCGTVEIYGYTLQDKLCDVYAPVYNHALSLKTIETQHAYYGLFGKLTNAGISVPNAEEIVLETKESDAVIHLKPLKSSVMDFVENNFTSVDIFTKQSKYIEPFLMDSSKVLSCSLTLSRPWKCFQENSNWTQVIQCGLKKHSRGIVCGGKGAGKSTFLRYCVNRLLSQGPVLVIDLDPGQCEFTVAGNLSVVTVTNPLIGPNYTHLTTPDRCINIGVINVIDNMYCYLEGVTQIIDYCLNNQHYADMPWVINTMGMCNSAGLKLITYTILKIKPTYLLQIDSKNQKKRFECYLNAHTVKRRYKDYTRENWFRSVDFDGDMDYNFFVAHQYTESKIKNSGSLAPRVARELNVLAYFGQLTELYHTKDILNIVPFRAPLSNFKISSNVRINKENVFRILNGKIIALCQQTSADNTYQPFVLQDKPLICHGYGIIRGVDPEKGAVYLVTPTSLSVLPAVNTFLYVDWMSDIRGYEHHLPNGVKVPYRMESLHEHKDLITAPKRRFNPIKFIKESRTAAK